MRSLCKLAVLIVIGACVLYVCTAYASTLSPGEDYVQGELLVAFSEFYMPSTKSISMNPSSFGIPGLDSILTLYNTTTIRKLIRTSDDTSPSETDWLERLFLIKYESQTDAQEIAEAFALLPYFEYVDVNHILKKTYHGTRRFDTGDDAEFDKQWNLHSPRDSIDIDAPEAWIIERGDSDVIIGIIDTGTMLDTFQSPWAYHSDFNFYWIAEEDSHTTGDLSWEDVWEGDDDNEDLRDDNIIGSNWAHHPPHTTADERAFWHAIPNNYALNITEDWTIQFLKHHGLFVSSIAAAQLSGANAVGIAHNCKIYVVRDGKANLSTAEYVSLLDHTALHADVINMSWGFHEPDSLVPLPIRTAIRRIAQDNNCVLVASAGNESSTQLVSYPARDPNVLGVGSIDSNLTWNSYSNYGAEGDIDVVAIGDHIHSDSTTNCGVVIGNPCTQPITETTGPTGWGTSFSAPQAAGVAALVRSRFPDLDQELVRERVQKSAYFYWTNTAENRKKYGSGYINMYRAVTEWGTITGHVEWDVGDARDNTFYISGDLTIGENDTLTINRGVTVKIAPDHKQSGNDSERVEIIVKGTLNVGATGTGDVVFESFDDTVGVGDWVGIIFDSTSTNNVLSNMVLKHARVGIDSEVPLTFTNCVVDSCDTVLVTTENVTLNNCTFNLASDLTFADSVTVTLGAGTDIVVDSSDVEFRINGSLDVNGTSGNPVTFKSANDAAGSQRSEWDGLYFGQSAKDLTIDYCIIKNAYIGIENQSLDSLEIDDSRIEECEIGIKTFGGMRVENTTITNLEDYGIYVAEGMTTLLADTVSYSELTGVQVFPDTGSDYSQARIEDCVIHDNDTYGIFSTAGFSGGHSVVAVDGGEVFDNDFAGITAGSNGSITVEYCNIHHNDTGFFDFGNDGLTVTECVIDSNTTGVYCYAADVSLEADSLLDNTVGVYAYSSDPLIKNFNVFDGNEEAIKCDNFSDAVVESTTVVFNDVGVVALNGSNPDVGHTSGGSSEGYNIIHHNSPYNIENEDTTVTVMAENNMWKTDEGPNLDTIYGNVDVFPWLTTPPDLSPPADESIEEETDDTDIPKYPVHYDLSSGYPNPFNPAIRLKFQVPRRAARSGY